MYIDIDYFIINEKKLIIILIKRDPLQLLKKHIVVTCNYVVHKYGVQKLQLWKNIYDTCLALLTIKGNFLFDKNSFCFDDRQKLLTLYWNTSIYFCGLFSSERKNPSGIWEKRLFSCSWGYLLALDSYVWNSDYYSSFVWRLILSLLCLKQFR